MAEVCPEGRLMGSSRATKPLLQFLADTAVGRAAGEAAQAVEREQRDNEWGLAELEEAEREEERGRVG